MRMPVLVAVVVIVTLLLLCGCSGEHVYRANITGATASTVDNYHAQGRGDEDSETSDISITPSASVGGDMIGISPAVSVAPPATAATPPMTATPPPPPVTIDPAVGPVHAVIDGKNITAPAGTTVTIHTAKHLAHQPEQTVRNRSAQGTGASIRTDATDGGANFNSSAPKSDLAAVSKDGLGGGGGNSDGGDTTFDWKAISTAIVASVKGIGWLWLVGIATMVLGLGYAAVERLMGGRIDWQLVIGSQIAGISFIATGIVAEQHPMVFLLLFLALVGVIVWYVWEWKRKQTTTIVSGTAPSTTVFTTMEDDVASFIKKLEGHAAPQAGASATAAVKPA